MAASDGSNEREWSELPGDILAAIYRSCSSAHDRLRFSAVCAAWHAAVSWQPPLPALPLLLMLPWPTAGGREAVWPYSPEDGRAMRVPLPSAVTPGTRLVGSHDGGWIAATSTSDDHQQQLMIVNLFSGFEVALSAKQRAVQCACPRARLRFGRNFKPVPARPAIKQIVFSGDPSSSGCILAATTGICNLALCRVGSVDDGWTTEGCSTGRYYMGRCRELVDISFCNGELNGLSGNNRLFLYGISRGEQLLMFEVAMNEGAPPVIATTHVISDLKAGIPCVPRARCHAQHIFELRGKIAIAVEWTNVRGEASFVVYELAEGDDATLCKYRLVEVTSLEEHTLFLSPGWSKAVHVSAAGARGGVYKNCIYYPTRHLSPFEGERYMKRLDLDSCIVYSCNNDVCITWGGSCHGNTITDAKTAVTGLYGFYLQTISLTWRIMFTFS